MTNLTDEGLTDMAGGIAEFHLKADCSCEWERQCRVCGLSWGILEVLKQVRDAAKKEERERCAKVVEGKEMVGEGYGVLHLGGWNQAIKVAVTAIRQMGGGK